MIDTSIIYITDLREQRAKLKEENSELRRKTKELLSCLKLAYRKHHMDDQTIGWEELSGKMRDTLCNVMGDDEFIKFMADILCDYKEEPKEGSIKMNEEIKDLSNCDHVITKSSLRSMPYSCKKCGRLFKTEDGGAEVIIEPKLPHLFYYDETEEGYIPISDDEIPGIICLDQFSKDGEVIELEFKRMDMTDAEFINVLGA
jgi:hypothetical protein